MADASRTVKVKLVASIDKYLKDVSTATAATRLLRQEAERVDGRKYRAKLDVDTTSALAKLRGLESAMGGLKAKQVGVSAGGNLRQQTGEIRALGSAIAALGPAGVAAGSVAGAALMGLSGSLTVVATSAGVGIAAFQGVGDALEALDSGNPEKVADALDRLTASGRNLALFLDRDMRPALRVLQETAATNMLPGVQRGLSEMLKIMPAVKGLVAETADTLGDLADENLSAFGTAQATEYVRYLQTRARPMLDTLVTATIDVGKGLGGMFRGWDVALGDNVLRTVREMSSAFADWGTNLRLSSGLGEFAEYVQEIGPKVGSTIEALASAFVAVAQAAAPISGPVLGAIESLARVVEAIADSPAGPAIFGIAAALGALNLAMKGMQGIQASPVLGFLGGIRDKGVAAGGAIGKVSTALGYLGPAAVVAVAATAGVAWAWDQLGSKAEENAERVARGSMTVTAAFDDELRRLRDRETVMAGMEGAGYAAGEAIGELTGKIDTNAKALAQENEAWALLKQGQADYLAGLAPLEQATARASIAQGNYALSVREFGYFAPQTKAALDELNYSTRESEIAQIAAAEGVDRNTAAMQRQKDLTMAAIDTNLAWHGALQTAKGLTDRYTASTDLSTEAGLRQREGLARLVDAANRDIEAKEALGGATEEVTRLANGHRDELIRVAEQTGMTRGEAELYIDAILRTPTSITTDFRTRGIDESLAKIGQLAAEIDGVYIPAGALPGPGERPGERTGAAIPARAAGGPIFGPGTGTSDSILARLSNGEYVQRASVVREQGLDRMAMLNAGRADIIPKYATGGLVSMRKERERGIPRWVELDFSAVGRRADADRQRVAAQKAAAYAGGTAAGGTGPVVDQVRAVMARRGWGSGPQWNALVRLLGGESSWNPTAQNPTSTAYGLFQFLNSTWATVGGRKTSNPGEQAEYGARYIAQRYGTPAAALAAWQRRSPHWYHGGGVVPGRGDRMVAAEGGERVLTTGQNERFERLVDLLDRPTPASPAALSGGVTAEALRPIINQHFENHFREAVDLDLLNARMDFAVRSASFGG